MYCVCCVEAQNDALREIEKILKRLEDAEGLFPSSKAFAELYPLYRSPEIVGRVRAMCQWYNMTKIQRLKLNILGKLVVLLDSKHSDWPCCTNTEENGSGKCKFTITDLFYFTQNFRASLLSSLPYKWHFWFSLVLPMPH